MGGSSDPFADPRVLRALAHPIRGAILELLVGDKCLAAGSVAEQLEIKAANASYHLDVLLACGAIEVAPEAQQGERLLRLSRPSRKNRDIGKKRWLDVSGSMRDDVSEAELKTLIRIASELPPPGLGPGAPGT